MPKKSVTQIASEVTGKRIRGFETKGGVIVVTLADGTEMRLSSERGSEAVTVEYGEMEEEATPAK